MIRRSGRFHTSTIKFVAHVDIPDNRKIHLPVPLKERLNSVIDVPSSHLDLLTRPIVVSLVTVMPDGQPQATPIWVDVFEGKIRLNTVAGRQKDKNLRERPMATVLAIDPDNPYRWMEVRGKVVWESEGDDREVIDKLSQDYVGTPYAGHNDSDRRVTFHIAPERVVTSG